MSDQHLPAPTENTHISPKFTIRDWRKLNLSHKETKGWARAADIFLDRVRGRFLKPVDAIRHHSDPDIAEFSGFSIMAIDCLLIETLAQFRSGNDQTPRPHVAAFAQFFRESAHFRVHFDTEQKAQVFYSHFRCGILHQAQTKRSSLIRYGLAKMVQLTVPGDVEQGLLIDRELFHAALINEIRDYSACIRYAKNDDDVLLRKNFVRKMAYIVGDAGNR